ncbi:minor tail protein [Fimbriiglobus ruber]|uniref:Minor tail protein n=1 Tax=Fimbriiglobus ruber TaxID=1908690 RepID=A0A225CY72_9BACT|nr:minor tail protein [Fimbriiglobus ruber]
MAKLTSAISNFFANVGKAAPSLGTGSQTQSGATPSGSGANQSSPPPVAKLLANVTPIAAALQPANVQMAMLVANTQKLTAGGTKANAEVKAQTGTLAQLQKGLGVVSTQYSKFTTGLGRAPQLFSGITNGLNSLTGSIQSNIASYVAAFSPTAVKGFEFAVLDLRASIGEALLPVMGSATALVRAVADSLASLSPKGKALVAALAAAATGMGALVAVTGVFSSVVSTATGGLSVLLGGIAGAAVGLGVMAAATKPLAELQPIFSKLSGVMKVVLDALGAGFTRVVTAITPIIDTLTQIATTGAGAVLKNVDTAISLFVNVIESIAPAIGSILPTLITVGVAAQKFSLSVLSLIKPIVSVLASLAPIVTMLLAPLSVVFDVLSAVVTAIGDVVTALLSPMKTAFDTIMSVAQPVVAYMQSVFVNALTAPLRIAMRIISGVANAFTSIVGIVKGVFDGIIAVIKPSVVALGDAFDSIGDTLSALANSVGPLVSSIGDALAPTFNLLKNIVLGAASTFARFVKAVADGIKYLVDSVNAFFGIKSVETPDTKGASEGKGVRNVSTGSVDDVIRKARESSFGIGQAGGEKPEVKIASTTAEIGVRIKELRDYFVEGKYIEPLATALGRAIGGTGGSVVSGVVSAATGGAVGVAAREMLDRHIVGRR